MNRPTPAEIVRRAGRASPRTVALAAVSGAVLLGALAVVAWRNQRPAGPAPTTGTTAPDIRDFSNLKSATGSGPAGAAVGKGRGFFVQYVDKNDPTRLAGELAADRSDPLPDRRYELTRPVAWFFQHDGRAIHVEAEKGRFTAPAENAQPSDGVLEGSVRIRVFAATPSGARPSLDSTKPELDVRTTRVSVDWVLGQVDMPEDVRASSDRVEFHGRGLSVQFDPATQRLDQLHVAALVEPITLKPAPPAPPRAATGDRTMNPAAPQPSAPEPETSTQAPEERFYTLTASDAVEVRQGNRVARADEVLGWARTLGNAVPGAEATANKGTKEETTRSTAQASVGNPSGAGGGVPAPEAPGQASSPAQSPGEATTLFWKGPLLVQRVEEKPSHLDRDDAVIELSAPTNMVTLEDTAGGLSALGTHLRYSATREQIAFTGTEASPALVSMRGAGKASAIAFEIDSQKGVVRVPGAGQLTGDTPNTTAATNDKNPSTIAWREQAEFQFDTLREKSASLQRATLIGGVTGTQGAFTITADSAIAEFLRPDSAENRAQTRNLLKAVQLVGHARAGDGKGGEFKGDTIHVAFDPPTGTSTSPVARRVEASGHALATRGEESLTSETITVTLARAASATPQPDPGTTTLLSGGAVERIDARGGFVFRGKDALSASGVLLSVQAAEKSAHLEGAPAVVERQGSTLRCAVLDLDGSKNSITATGKGDFVRTPPADAPASPLLEASWTRSMVLADTEGTLALEGDARFHALAGETTAREDSRVRAESIRVAFEHSEKSPSASQPRDGSQSSGDPLLAAAGDSRRVLRASGESNDPANPVRLEVRRGVADGAGNIEGRTLYIEGPAIHADNEGRVVRVPGAGKLLNSDRRADLDNASLPTAGSRATQDASLPGSSRGDALFSWKQSATLDLAAGSANLEGSVRMVHRRLDDSALTELECEHLLATLEEDIKTRRLSSVRAEGGVWARSQGREMTGQLAVYNAPLGILEATDPTGGDVHVSDPRSGEPLSAKAIRWDLSKGRIEIIDPGAISGPR